jgi:hypothetical protein
MSFNAGKVKEASAQGRFRLADARICKGPVQEGVSGSGSFSDRYGKTHACKLEPNGSLKLYSLSGSSWTLDSSVTLSASARMASQCFDQGARRVICYELSGQIRMRRWNPTALAYETVTIGAGIDPLVINDAIVRRDNGGADIHILFVDPVSRNRVLSVRQSDNYTVTRTIATFSKKINLLSVQTLFNQLQLILIDESAQISFLLSEAYPYPVSHETKAVAFPGNVYHQNNTFETELEDTLSTRGDPSFTWHISDITEQKTSHVLQIVAEPGTIGHISNIFTPPTTSHTLVPRGNPEYSQATLSIVKTDTLQNQLAAFGIPERTILNSTLYIHPSVSEALATAGSPGLDILALQIIDSRLLSSTLAASGSPDRVIQKD